MPDRLFVLAPSLSRLAIRLVLHLRIDSRLRRTLLTASLRLGWAAFNRLDWEPMFVRYAPDAEFIAAPGLQSLGVSDMPRQDAARRTLSETAEVFQVWQLMRCGFIDLGNRLVTLGTQRAEGAPAEPQSRPLTRS
jgi:hypothetical protein